MAEIERTRTRERGTIDGALYETFLKRLAAFHDRQQEGKVLIKKADVVAQMSRQSHAEYFLATDSFPTVLQDWRVFISNIRRQSGKHRHQGGLIIFVLEGSGWTILRRRAARVEQGDLILLPIKPAASNISTSTPKASPPGGSRSSTCRSGRNWRASWSSSKCCRTTRRSSATSRRRTIKETSREIRHEPP